MIWMVLWISNIIYSAGLIEQIFELDKNSTRFGLNDTFNVDGMKTKDYTLDAVPTERSQLEQQEKSFLKDGNVEKQLNITGNENE